MEEENELGMNLFDSNFELNFDDAPDMSNEEDDENINEENNTVEESTPEEVDSDNDGHAEGSDEDDSSDSSSNLYSSLASFIHEQGLLPSLDLNNIKIETADDFANAFKNELNIQAKVLLDDYINNIDLDSIKQSRSEINDLEQVTEEYLKDNIEVAKQIIYQDYMNQGLDEKKAARLLTRLIDLGEDAILEDALESTESLKEYNARKIESAKEEYEKNLQMQKEEQAKNDKIIKDLIFERTDLINGLTVNKALQDKVYSTMNEIVGKSPVDGSFENKFMKDRRENPIEFETRMYFMYELTNGFRDFSKISQTAKSKAVKDLETIAKRGSYKESGKPSWMTDKNSYDTNFGDELNL